MKATEEHNRWIVVLVVCLVLIATALGLSIYVAAKEHVVAGLLGCVFVCGAAPIGLGIAMRGLSSNSGSDTGGSISTKLDNLHDSVKSMAQQATLSDDARRVLNRQRERELLNATIEQDIASGNFDGALVLITELADRFGYRADAEQFRTRIDQMRRASVEAEVTGAIAGLDAIIAERRWDEAYAEAGRIGRLFPSSTRSERLDERVREAHDGFKKELERDFLVATQAGDLEKSISLLRQLDAYLLPREAEPLRELARGVIGKARDNLGASFKLAVQDRRWAEAASLGEQIIQQFPNSRMAAEVRDVIDGVRARAT